ncbi:hypothetical protein BKP35_17525 [Anaerobacillus arseniciselenatis]|uniref:HTH gntR-type domain-containing protein n=1 Tax=Anaerobacillus arseniciselenatis TaxID=85682 RepID=A0A1S2L869_9BACI|nr:GntR family transcriptional regulator [Anaerobacillus arseniciselenatis]OIJ08709.1 hypothetical protein BKP35_17525 [Anaerobacillus arseniciselenatis]
MELQRPKPLYKQVYEKLKSIILAGELPFGERINEVHIAKKLNVSRGPVREAMQKLEQEGLLVRQKRNQLYIFTPTKKDLLEIYQCRKALESLATQIAAENITENEKLQFKEIIKRSKATINQVNQQSDAEFIFNNEQFHDFILAISKNQRLQTQLTQLRLLTNFYRQFSAREKGRKKEVFEDHYEIYEAIISQKSKEASKLMALHIERDLQYINSIIEGEVKSEEV